MRQRHSRTDRSRALADLGLVTAVVGGALTIALSVMTLGLGALLGRIPIFILVLLGICILFTVAGVVVTIITNRAP